VLYSLFLQFSSKLLVEVFVLFPNIYY
jgi:hypothetical protein